MKRLVSSLVLAVLAVLAVSVASCGSTSGPDARVPTPTFYDARPPDAKPAPDAGAPDAT